MRLEARDRQVLAETLLHRVIRRDDLLALRLFTSIPRCNARLGGLVAADLLRSHREISGISLQAPFYSCTSPGIEIAAETLGIDTEGRKMLSRSRLRDQAIRHALKCLDLHVKFLRDLSCGPCRLVQWAPELLCHHQFAARNIQITIKPDALALVASPALHHLFIEVDLGNVAMTRLAEKLRKYAVYEHSGAFKDVYGMDRFVVVFVTTDERRLAAIRSLRYPGQLLASTWTRLARPITDAVWTNGEGDQGELVRVLQ